MKLRKAIKLAAAGAMAGVSSAALAVPTTGNFSATGGVVSATCPVGYTCSTTPITDSGFMQRNMTETSTGRTFIQTILTEGDTNGTTFTGNVGFADESFVEMGGAEGIISKQMLADRVAGAGVTEDFNSTAQLSTGQFMMMGMANPMIQLDQTISETDSGAGDGFNTGFAFDHGMNMAGMVGYDGKFAKTVITGGVTSGEFSADFKQETLVNEGVTTGTAAALAAEYKKLDAGQTLVGEVTQTVALSERTGAAVSEAGGTDANGTGADFAAGDTIVQLMIGQSTSGAGEFGLHDFVNESTSTEFGIDSQVTSAVPFQTVTFTSGGDPFATF